VMKRKKNAFVMKRMTGEVLYCNKWGVTRSAFSKL